MTVYALAQLKIHDRPTYERYMAGFMPVLTKYKGRLLAADEQPRVLEGRWERDKVVLMAFEDAQAFRAWASSPEYTEIAKDRLASADAIVLLLQGVS